MSERQRITVLLHFRAAAQYFHLSLNFRCQPSVQLQRESLALLVVEQWATIFIPWDRICR
jgi:hypothetical protein